MAGCRLVNMLVGPRGRAGLVTPTPNAHLPALCGGPFHVQLGGVGFCPLDRAAGVNPRFSLRYGHGMRLVVLVPQHQTAVYETSNVKSYWRLAATRARHVISWL
jgi:hypothetical protein